VKRPPIIELLTAALALRMIYETGQSTIICIRNLAEKMENREP